MLIIDHLDYQKLQAQNMVIHTLTTAPTSPVEGQVYSNTNDHILYFHNGTGFVPLVKGPGSSTDNNVPQWDGTAGALLKDGYSVVTTLGDPGSDSNLATEAAIRAAITAGSGTDHAFLSSTHTDVVASSPVRGDIVVANSTPEWEALSVGTNQLLHADGTDAAWTNMATLATGGGLQTATSSGNTLLFQAYDDIGGTPAYKTFITLTAGATATCDLDAGVTINSNAIAYSGGAFHDGFSDYDSNEHIDHTSVSITLNGTANEVDVTGSAQTIDSNVSFTIGLPSTVNIDTELQTPKIGAHDGTDALTIADSTGDVTVGNNLTVTGNLTVNGTSTIVNTTTLSVDDPIIELADGNSADSVDIGFYWTYNDGTEKYGGIFRDVSDADRPIVFYEESTTDPGTGTSITWSTYADVAFGTVRNGVWNGDAIDEVYGGTGLTTYATGDMLYASASNTLSKLSLVANSVLLSNATIPTWQTLTTNGQIIIGGTSGPNADTLTAGTGIDITNGDGSIEIAVDTTTITRITSANIGDGDASYTWNHGLGLSVDTDIIVQVWGVNVDTDKQVFPSITVVDSNNIQFDFGFNVTSGDYKAVLIY